MNRWLVRLIVLRETGEIVGNLGFHGAPDASGTLEVGLEVHPAFRRRGIAREALLGLWAWGCSQAGVRTLRWSAAPGNVASIALAASFGFRCVGEQLDEIDGRELIYEISVAAFLERNPGARRTR